MTTAARIPTHTHALLALLTTAPDGLSTRALGEQLGITPQQVSADLKAQVRSGFLTSRFTHGGLRILCLLDAPSNGLSGDLEAALKLKRNLVNPCARALASAGGYTLRQAQALWEALEGVA